MFKKARNRLDLVVLENWISKSVSGFRTHSVKHFFFVIKHLSLLLFSYDKDVATITERFQSELKAAFSGDTGSMDLLNRLQDLEVEIEETRKDRDTKIKEITELCEKEKEQMKEDMATVLQVRLNFFMFVFCCLN